MEGWIERTALSPCASRASFDHLVGAREQRWRHVETEGLRGFEIDDQLDLTDCWTGKSAGSPA
jgi:hypothetical protein